MATNVLLHEIGHTIGSQGKNLEEIMQRIKEEKSMLPELRSKPTKEELLKHAKMYRNLPSEKAADEFAARFIDDHLQELFPDLRGNRL